MSYNVADWISTAERKPPQTECDGRASKIVEVLLDNGEVTTDFLIDGKWTYYCEKNPGVPKIIAWREINAQNLCREETAT